LSTTTTADTDQPRPPRPDIDRPGIDRPDQARKMNATWPVIAVTGATVLILLSPATRLLLYGFPLMALLLAGYLYRRNLARYVEVICWLWFLTPLLRRLVDYRVGWIPATAVLLGPVLALCTPALWLVADWRTSLRRLPGPLICILITCAYATVLGLLNFGPRLVFQDLLTWIAPLIFAIMLSQHKDQATELFQAFERAFLYGTLLVSVYGLLQFFFLPAWDVLWMEQMDLPSLGLTEPTKVRVFSTMNSPQILASFLVVGLLIAFNSRRRIRFLTVPFGLLCLVLSLARSGWVAMIAGSVFLLFKLPQKQRVYLVVAAVFSAGVFLVALQNPDLQQVVSKRFESLSDVRNDVSYSDRVDGYKAVLSGFIDNPFGLGMGATPAIAEDLTGTVGYVHGGKSLALGDSTVLTIITTMGFAGGLVFFAVLLPLGRNLFSGTSAQDAYTWTMQAALIGLTAEAVLDSIIAGPTAFLTWAGVGFCIALRRSTADSRSLAADPSAAADSFPLGEAVST
jgi:O-Antigen ligase